MRKSLDLARSGGVWGELAVVGVVEEERERGAAPTYSFEL